MTTRTRYAPLNARQEKALTDYAAAHGAHWKADLRDDWIHARLPGDLHTLRNSHGPSWLASYRLPVAAVATVDAAAAARALGRRGGHARAAALTKAQRSESARKAITARWAKRRAS